MYGNDRDLDMVGKIRESNMNPAEFPPGQVNDPFGLGTQDPLSQGTNGGNNGNPFGGGADYGSPLGGSGGDANIYNGFNQAPQNTPKSFGSDVEMVDKFLAVTGKALVIGGKGLGGFTKRLIESMMPMSATYLVNWGRQMCIGAIVSIVVGMLLLFTGQSGFFLPILISSLFILGIGTMLFMFNYSRYKEEKDEIVQDIPIEPEPQEEPTDSQEVPFQCDLLDEDYNEDIFEEDEDEEDEDDWINDRFEEEPDVDVPLSIDDALDSLPEVNKGMYTRQYLYEMLTKVLPSYAPNFSEFEEFDETDELFLTFQDAVTEAAEVMGLDEDNTPNVLSVSKNMFIIRVVTERSSKLKAQQLADEVASIYAEETGCEDAYALSKTVGRECIITLFPGNNEDKVSLLDCMSAKRDFFLNTKNYMPVTLGVDESGNVIVADLKKLDSLFISGMSRSGKTWFAKSVLLQMCSFVSPEELNIYICDVKGGVSDFKSFSLPHVKSFASDAQSILKTLRWVVRTEGARRKKLLGNEGCINIWGFRDKCPNVKLPLIYVVVDEVISLTDAMDKEENSEFQSLVTVLVSQLPNLGIRLMMVPHVIKNEIIKKTASDLVPCRISVRGDAAHIESCCGLKPKEFPYKLVCAGDMAVRLKLDNFKRPLFVHASVIADDDNSVESIFDYMRSAWTRLEPEEAKNSVYNNNNFDDLLAKADSEDWVDDEDIFGEEEKPRVELDRGTGNVSVKKPSKSRVLTTPKKEQSNNIKDKQYSPDDFLGLDDLGEFGDDLFDD